MKGLKGRIGLFIHSTECQLLSLSDIDWEASSMSSCLISASYSGSHREGLTSFEQSAVLCPDGGSNQASLNKQNSYRWAYELIYHSVLKSREPSEDTGSQQVARFKHCLMLHKAAQTGSTYRRRHTCDTPVFILITVHYITANIREIWYITDLWCNRMECVRSPIRHSIL
jgi:hypothetical protein